ncbi:hypothetical protein [Chryseobacterium sp. Hurlbut01]|jgi:hypothetical protein|uniref:hypothetical protein n=1 Tax=Chryseobacterium sp. Hurlbut01 TaxID=1681828 RepID=UPI00067DF17B|nr:hypothetical protein [Chryseobacterium sp. Hurlbut01]KNB60909.1 hypothetical protein AC804_17305 [Chryseobacterium sp. Hurlbut01]
MISGKKIFYVPGLISALLIPVLFWYFGNRKLNEPIPNVMDFGLLAKLTKENHNDYFEAFRNWNYQKIIVQPNSAKSNSAFYVSKLKKLQKRNEKKTGIEFILNDYNTYGDFASLLNDMAIAKHETYGLDLDKTGHLFALTNYQDPNAKEIEYDCLLCNDVIRDEYKPTFLDDAQFFIKQLPKESFYLIFGFLIFLNISMFSVKERFLN